MYLTLYFNSLAIVSPHSKYCVLLCSICISLCMFVEICSTSSMYA